MCPSVRDIKYNNDDEKNISTQAIYTQKIFKEDEEEGAEREMSVYRYERIEKDN